MAKYFILLSLFLFSCTFKETKKLHTITIVDIYQEQINPNDGEYELRWRTIAVLEDSSRVVMDGKFGVPGDTMYNMEMVWSNGEITEWRPGRL